MDEAPLKKFKILLLGAGQLPQYALEQWVCTNLTPTPAAVAGETGKSTILKQLQV